MERQKGVPKGVTWQVIGEHSGNKVCYPERMSVDNRDNRRHGTSENPHEFTCKELVHFTENTFAVRIGLSDTDPYFSFEPCPWETNALEKNLLKLTWWSPRLPVGWKNSLNESDFNDFKQIGNSGAIDGASICGPIGFVAPWKHILKQYVNARRESLSEGVSSGIELELRNLGTFLYKREIMYGVLVCMEG